MSSPSLRHFIAGAVPAAAAILLLLVHALRPLVAYQHQGYLFITAGALIAVSLGVWCWCVVRSTASPFADRNTIADERQLLLLEQIADNHRELLHEQRRTRSTVGAVHRRLDAIEKRIGSAEGERAEITAEIAHLRQLVLQQDNLATLGQERLGPRPLH